MRRRSHAHRRRPRYIDDTLTRDLLRLGHVVGFRGIPYGAGRDGLVRYAPEGRASWAQLARQSPADARDLLNVVARIATILAD